MKILKTLRWAALATGIVAGSSASAAVINFYNDGGNSAEARFSISCTLGCEGYIFSSSTFDPSLGSITAFPSGAQNIATAVNTATGEDYSPQPEIAPSSMFESSAAYITIKIGGGGGNGGGNTNSFALLKNTGGEGNKFTFTELMSGAGFSHYREFGSTMSPVPLPAAAWMLLVGLGGLLAFKRRS